MAKMPRFVRGTRPEVDGLLVGEVAPLGDLDGIDLPDQVGDRDVGRRELLTVAGVPADPRDRQLVAEFLGAATAGAADRLKRVVVDLAAVDDGDGFVEQTDEAADQTALRLTALAEEHHVVTGEDRVLDLGDDGLLVADDPREDRLARPEASDQVLAHLLAHGEDAHPVSLELSERPLPVRRRQIEPSFRRGVAKSSVGRS